MGLCFATQLQAKTGCGTHLPNKYAWEDECQTAFYMATGTDAVAVADQAARAADHADQEALKQRLKAQEAAQQASDLRNIAAEKADDKKGRGRTCRSEGGDRCRCPTQ